MIDIVPTILDATGIPAPVMVDGIGQKQIEGVSMAYTFDKANADAPSHHHTQYFEMFGVQGLSSEVGCSAQFRAAHRGTSAMARSISIRPALSSSSSTTFDMTGRRIRMSPHRTQKVKGDDGSDVRRVPQIPGASARCLGDNTCGHTAPSLVAGRKVFTYSGEPVTGIPDGTAPNPIPLTQLLPILICREAVPMASSSPKAGDLVDTGCTCSRRNPYLSGICSV